MLTMKQIVQFLLVLSGLLISVELFACYIAPPQYLCWEYWEEYSAEGITETNPEESYYFPVEGGATVKHTFLLKNSTNPDGAYSQRLTVAPNEQDIVSVVSQPAFDVPSQETEYAVIEYTAPMSLGRYDITIHILDENGDRVSSEKGLTSQIEVTSLPAPPPPDNPNPVPDYDPPWAEVADIESNYVVGDTVFYSATAGDNGNLLSWVDLLVIDANGNQLYSKLWDNIRLDSFQESDSFPTTDWAEGTYYYELRVKDVAGNEVLAEESSFQLATLPPDEPPPPPPPQVEEKQICGSVEPVKLSSSQLLEQDGNILMNGTTVTVLSEGNATEIKVNHTSETGYVATTNLSEVCTIPTPLERLHEPDSGEVVVSTPFGIYARIAPNIITNYVDVNGDGSSNTADIIPYNATLTVLKAWRNWLKVSFSATDGQLKEGWIYRASIQEGTELPEPSARILKKSGTIAWAHDMTVDLRMLPDKSLNEIIWESYEGATVQILDHVPPFQFIKIESPAEKQLDGETIQQYGRLYEGIVALDLNVLQTGISGWVHQDFIKRDGQTYDTPFAYPFDYDAAKSAPIAEKGLVTQIFFEEVMGQIHECIDYNLEQGTPVLAASRGTVTFAGLLDGLGKTVVLSHDNGYFTAYAHLQEISVATDDVIPMEVQVGTVGGTADHDAGSKKPHLHFCVRNDGEPKGDWKKALNPTKYITGYNPSDAHQCVKELIVDAGIRDISDIILRCVVGIGGISEQDDETIALLIAASAKAMMECALLIQSDDFPVLVINEKQWYSKLCVIAMKETGILSTKKFQVSESAGIRTEPILSDDAKTGNRLNQGDIIEVLYAVEGDLVKDYGEGTESKIWYKVIYQGEERYVFSYPLKPIKYDVIENFDPPKMFLLNNVGGATVREIPIVPENKSEYQVDKLGAGAVIDAISKGEGASYNYDGVKDNTWYKIIFNGKERYVVSYPFEYNSNATIYKEQIEAYWKREKRVFDAQDRKVGRIKSLLHFYDDYLEAEKETDVPWEIFAAIHYREIGSGATAQDDQTGGNGVGHFQFDNISLGKIKLTKEECPNFAAVKDGDCLFTGSKVENGDGYKNEDKLRNICSESVANGAICAGYAIQRLGSKCAKATESTYRKCAGQVTKNINSNKNVDVIKDVFWGYNGRTCVNETGTARIKISGGATFDCSAYVKNWFDERGKPELRQELNSGYDVNYGAYRVFLELERLGL